MKLFIRLAFILMLTARITNGQDFTNLTFFYAGGLDGWATAEHDARVYLETNGVDFPEGASIQWENTNSPTLVLRNTPENIKKSAQVLSRINVLPIYIRLKIATTENDLYTPKAETFLCKGWMPNYGTISYTADSHTNIYAITVLGTLAEKPQISKVAIFIAPRRNTPPYTPQEDNYPTNDIRLVNLYMTNGIPMGIPFNLGQNPEHGIQLYAVAEELLESGQPLW
jgi:hypothetical protein